MFWINIKRIIRSGFVNFWRNGFVSLASILVITITLFLICSLIFFSAVLNFALEELRNKVDINVYFTVAAEEEEILALKGNLESLAEVSSVEYTMVDVTVDSDSLEETQQVKEQVRKQSNRFNAIENPDNEKDPFNCWDTDAVLLEGRLDEFIAAERNL